MRRLDPNSHPGLKSRAHTHTCNIPHSRRRIVTRTSLRREEGIGSVITSRSGCSPESPHICEEVAPQRKLCLGETEANVESFTEEEGRGECDDDLNQTIDNGPGGSCTFCAIRCSVN